MVTDDLHLGSLIIGKRNDPSLDFSARTLDRKFLLGGSGNKQSTCKQGDE